MAKMLRAVRQTSPTKLILAICLTPIFATGLVFFILWLGLHPHRPSIHIQNFSVPGLNQTGLENAKISYNVTVRNPNRSTWIYYESLDGSIYYKDQQGGVMPLLYSFNQAPKNTTILLQESGGVMNTSMANNQRWMEILDDPNKEVVIFRLRLASIIQYKKTIWDRKHHRMHANCEVGVGPDGKILPTFVDHRCSVSLG